MQDVIERATAESARLGHNYVGTEHVLLAIHHDEPTLLEPYGVTRAELVHVITTELLRIAIERRDLRSAAEPVPSGITPRLTAALDDAHSTSPHDVLAAILDEDSNLAVVALDRLGVPLDELRRHLN